MSKPNDPIAGMLRRRHAGEARTFTPGEVERLLEELAALQAKTAHQERLLEELQPHVLADPATGLANTRTLGEEIRKSLATSRRYGRLHGLLRLEVADYESLAALGEETAQAVLRHTASLIRQNIRANDIAARTGGGRFCVILNELRALENAEMRVSELARTIAQTPCITSSHALHVNVATAAFVFGADDDYEDVIGKTTAPLPATASAQ